MEKYPEVVIIILTFKINLFNFFTHFYFLGYANINDSNIFLIILYL